MPFPFFVLGLFFAAGAWGASFAPWPLPALAPAILLPLGLAWRAWVRGSDRAAFFFLLFSASSLGLAVFSEAEARYARNPLRSWPEDAYADFRGTLVRSPSPGIDRDRLDLRVERVDALDRSLSARGRVRFSIPHSPLSSAPRDLLAGDRVRLAARLLAPRDYRNLEEPFSGRFLRTQGLHAMAATKSPLLIEKTGTGHRFSPRRLVSGIRRTCLRRIEAAFGDPSVPGGLVPEGAVFEALILGERSRLNADVTMALQRTGLFHLIAISGAHIGIIAALLFGLLRAVRVPPRISSGILIIVLFAYSFLVEGGASVTRASSMAILYFAGRLLWKDVHLLNTLGLSAMAILAVDPFAIRDLGFTLTYAATLSILLFAGPLLRRLPRLPLKLSEILALSVSAQMGVLPLVAVAFHRIALSGLLLNFLDIPLVSLIMAAGYIYFPLSFLGEGVARAAAAPLRLLLGIFLRSLHLLDGVPALSFRVPGPPAWACLGYTAALASLLAVRAPRPLRRAAGGGLAVFSLLLVILPLPARSSGLRLTFIDVGQGDSALVQLPGSGTMLIDGGGLAAGTFDVGENIVSPVLWAKGLRKVGTLVLTHAHPDHRGGLAAVARNFSIGEFWTTAPPLRDAAAEALDAALGKTARWSLAAGAKREIGGVTFEVLWPGADFGGGPGGENDRSLVLRIVYGETSFLLAGDIGGAAEDVLLQAGRTLRSTVLKVAHHGSRSSSTSAFLEAVKPEVAVLSVGRGNAYGLPDAAVVDRLARVGARLFRTDLHGAVEVVSDGRRIRVRTIVPSGEAVELTRRGRGRIIFP